MEGRILIVQFSASFDGSAISGLMLADGLREAGWETYVVFGHDGPIIDRFRNASHKVSVAPHKNWIRTNRYLYFFKILLKEIQASKAISKLIVQIQPDLVYVNTSVSFAGAYAAHKQRRPCIWHLRELFANVGGEMKVPLRLKPFVRAFFRRRASRLVVNSKSVAANMVGTSMRPVDVVPNAVSPAFFDYEGTSTTARRTLGLPGDGIIIGVPGTLRPMKGHPFFFRALKHLIEAHPDLVVAVSGDGEPDYVQSLKTMVADLGLASRIQFMGFVSDMPSFYRACDLVCIPSVAEPFGRTIIEAFAAKTPVVATAVGGIPETVDDGHNGLLVAYGNEQELADALERVLADGHLREKLRRNAFEKACKNYHDSVYKSRICQIVAEVSGQHNKQDTVQIA